MKSEKVDKQAYKQILSLMNKGWVSTTLYKNWHKETLDDHAGTLAAARKIVESSYLVIGEWTILIVWTLVLLAFHLSSTTPEKMGAIWELCLVIFLAVFTPAVEASIIARYHRQCSHFFSQYVKLHDVFGNHYSTTSAMNIVELRQRAEKILIAAANNLYQAQTVMNSRFGQNLPPDLYSVDFFNRKFDEAFDVLNDFALAYKGKEEYRKEALRLNQKGNEVVDDLPNGLPKVESLLDPNQDDEAPLEHLPTSDVNAHVTMKMIGTPPPIFKGMAPS